MKAELQTNEPKKQKMLTFKEEAFAQAYIQTEGKSIEAYKIAYNNNSNYNVCNSESYKILNRPHVYARIKELRGVLEESSKVTLDELILELSAMIRFDPADMFDDNGAMLPIKTMPKPVRQMIQSLDLDELYIGKGENREAIGVTKKVKLISKLDSIEKMMKYFGAYEKDNRQKQAVQQVMIFNLPNNGR